MHQLHWNSETLRVTVVSVRAETVPPGERGGWTSTKRLRPLARVGFALMALALLLLATGQGRGLLAGVQARYFRDAVLSKYVLDSRRRARSLPAGPG